MWKTGRLLLLALAITSQTSIAREARRVTVAGYYYPWHGDDFHRNYGYLRRMIDQRPALGEYNDRKPDVIRQHMAWSEQANMEVWIASWWGPASREDYTLLYSTLPTIRGSKQKLAIFYETTDRGGKRNQTTTTRVVDDINYFCDHYFDHPNFYKINGRPVIVMYLTRRLAQEKKLAEILLLMRTAAARRGHNIYIVGDHSHGSPPTTPKTKSFDYLDAITNYDVYGSLAYNLGDLYAGEARVREYSDNQRQWKVKADAQSCAYIPAVTPGFNDRGVRLEVDREPLSRQLTRNDDEGSLFVAQMEEAIHMVDSRADYLLIVNSFNEWHEDTQIEPNLESPISGRLTAEEKETYTVGLDYEIYGTLYLDLLNAMTSTTTDGLFDLPDGYAGDGGSFTSSASTKTKKQKPVTDPQAAHRLIDSDGNNI